MKDQLLYLSAYIRLFILIQTKLSRGLAPIKGKILLRSTPWVNERHWYQFSANINGVSNTIVTNINSIDRALKLEKAVSYMKTWYD